MEYKDILESWIAELNETPEDKQFLATLKYTWGKSDVFNNNHRLYSDVVATPAITAFNKESQKGAGIVGQLDHPIGTAGTLLANASHLVTKVWKDKEKVWWAEVKIMNTSRGRDLLAVVKTGAKIGASLRGVGEIDREGKVKSGLEIRAIDFVSSPSFGASATIDQSNVFESFIPEEEDEFNEEDMKQLTDAMDSLSDETIKMIQEKLEKTDNIKMTPERIKGLILWIKCSKDNPNIAPFHEWFVEQQKKFGVTDSNLGEELNDGLRREATLKEEKNIAGGGHSANTMYGGNRKRIEARQKEIDEALSGSKYDQKTISRLFAEAVLAGYKGSRADWIREFGF